MKHFLFSYESEKNLFKGDIVISAASLSDAQTSFLNWLQTQKVYSHLWRLQFEAKEVASL